MEYQKFLRQKALTDIPTGLDKIPKLNSMLFDFQRDIVKWGLRRGRACIWADCGLGKTPMQLEWANHVPGEVLILAPLAVSQQTIREGEKFGIKGIQYCRSQKEVKSKITITNYEMLEHFNPDHFTGIVMDESSLLKNFNGKFRNLIIESFHRTPFRLACTATPSPNDYMELGNHAEFLGVMSYTEMLSMFFVHDGGDTQQWRLKGHAEEEFWKWLCSWAVMLRKPSDLGYDDNDFILPPYELVERVAEVDFPQDGGLFPEYGSLSLQDRQKERRNSIEDRVKIAAEIVAQEPDESWLLWCNLNSESEALASAIPGAVEMTGSDSLEKKEKNMLGFSQGKPRILVTKPKIAGFGMNWQHCSRMIFVGLSDSYEQFYQAFRRCWRFGQQETVKAYIVTASTEGPVVRNIKRKERDAQRMAREMVKHMSHISSTLIHGTERDFSEYNPQVEMKLPKFLEVL